MFSDDTDQVALVGADCNGGAVLLKAMTNASPEELKRSANRSGFWP